MRVRQQKKGLAWHPGCRRGSQSYPCAVGLDTEKDWRIALSIAGGLAARGDQRCVEAAEVMHADARLPDAARADAGNEFAVALIQSQSCRRAAAVLSDVLTKDPDSVPALLNLGVAKACPNDADGARDAFLRVLHVQPGHELALRNLQAPGAAAP